MAGFAQPGATAPPAGSRPGSAQAGPSGARGTLGRLSSNPKARIGAAIAGAVVVVVLALRAKKKGGAGTTVTGTDASKTDNAAGGGVDPTIGEILAALDAQGSATATLVDAANALTDAAAGLGAKLTPPPAAATPIAALSAPGGMVPAVLANLIRQSPGGGGYYADVDQRSRGTFSGQPAAPAAPTNALPIAASRAV